MTGRGWQTTMIRGQRPARAGGTNVLYFAYGSNLDEAQMKQRCPSAIRGPRAVLPGYALTFGGFSHRWGGAVASIVRAHGVQVEGLLYSIDALDLAALDRFEGHPFAYQRVERIVLDEQGRRRRPNLYLMPEDGWEPWEPGPAYFAVLRRAYARLGFDRRSLAAAARVAA